MNDIGIIGTVHFQVDNDVAACGDIVKHEVRVKVLAVDGNALLSPDKCETSSQLEHELFEMGDDGAFKFGFL